MAVAVMVEWPGVTPEQYDEARKLVGWELEPPDGGIFHAARFADLKLYVGDVWGRARSSSSASRRSD